MDLRGLDKEWRGFSDLEIRKVKGSPDHPPAARAPVPGTKRASMANSRAGSQQQRRLGGGGGGGGQSVPRPTRSQQEVAPEDTSADSSLDQADSALDQEPLWALPPPEGDRECEGRSLKDPVPEERDADTESAGNDRLQPFTPVEEDIVKVKKQVNLPFSGLLFHLKHTIPPPRPSELELRLQKEKNEKTKELVEKRLRERYVLSQQESENLKQVQRELASLDQLATRDIGVLQEKIESAGRRYDRSR